VQDRVGSHDIFDEYPEPDRCAVVSGTPHEATIAELFLLCDEFLRHASPAVYTELAQFLTEHGYHPVAGLGAFIDSLGFTTLDWARSAGR
jgi:hypothetical protein